MSLKKQQSSEDWDKKITSLAKRLKRYQPPEELWDKIEARLQVEIEKTAMPAKAKTLWHQRMVASLRYFRAPDARWSWVRIGVAAATILLVILSSTILIRHLWQPDLTKSPDAILVRIDGDLEHAERQYLQVIDRLTQLAKENEKNVEPHLLALYQEKLTLLDESIRECKNALKNNYHNPVVQLALFDSYHQKVETLKMIIHIKSENQFKEVS